jgi:hypothetical protein
MSCRGKPPVLFSDTVVANRQEQLELRNCQIIQV